MLVAAAVPPAQARSTEVLHGTGGAADRSMFLTFVSCDSFFAPASAPRTRINLGPGVAPLGARSMGLVPTAAGTASGPFVQLGSVASAAAGVSVTAAGGTSGASYVWYSAPGVPQGQAWSGRAALSVPAGGWHQVEAAALRYTWTLYDLTSRQPVEQGGEATLAQFAAGHGDGPGYVVTGFGCDGRAFNVDAVSAGARVFDFEGISLSTAISTSAPRVRSGQQVVVTGSVRDPGGRTTGDPLQLEARTAGGEWRPLGPLTLAGRDGLARAEVTLDADTELRWHRPAGQYADEGWSESVLVTVEQPPAEAPVPAPEQQDKQKAPDPGEPQPAPSEAPEEAATTG